MELWDVRVWILDFTAGISSTESNALCTIFGDSLVDYFLDNWFCLDVIIGKEERGKRKEEKRKMGMQMGVPLLFGRPV